MNDFSRKWLVVVGLTVCQFGFWENRAKADVSADYKISPLDIIIIDVVGEKDLNREVRVSSGGTITFAWLANVEVKGKTASEVEQILRELLDRDYLVEPTVMVSVKDYRSREATVLGPVGKPGAVALPGEQKLNIVEVIARAGGMTKFANENKIKLTRAGKTQTLSLEELKKVVEPEKTIFVEPGDLIEITERVF